MTGPRILIIDIETLPALVYTFTLRDTFIGPGQVKEPDRMGGFSAKWHGEDRVFWYSEFHHGRRKMLDAAFALLDEADVVVTYNGDNFDIPWLRRELHPLQPSPFVSVDLYKVLKKNHRYLSHKLGYITAQLDLSGKLGHEGFDMWIKCIEPNHPEHAKAWNAMRRYGKQDAVTTDELFTEARPLITNLPSPALFDESLPLVVCPNCPDGGHLQRRGFAYTKTRRYPRYQCMRCGKWSRGTRSDMGVSTS